MLHLNGCRSAFSAYQPCVSPRRNAGWRQVRVRIGDPRKTATSRELPFRRGGSIEGSSDGYHNLRRLELFGSHRPARGRELRHHRRPDEHRHPPVRAGRSQLLRRQSDVAGHRRRASSNLRHDARRREHDDLVRLRTTAASRASKTATPTSTRWSTPSSRPSPMTPPRWNSTLPSPIRAPRP